MVQVVVSGSDMDGGCRWWCVVVIWMVQVWCRNAVVRQCVCRGR
jgi:hypothetical protein